MERKDKDKKITREYYDSDYFEAYPDFFDLSRSKFQQYRVNNVMEIYTPAENESILDVGVGWGTFSFYVSRICREVIGIDYSLYSVTLCNNRAEELGKSNIRFICADAQWVPLTSEKFDTIICADLVEHLYPDQFDIFIEECFRLLKKNGKLIIWAPNQEHWLEVLRKNRIILQPYEGHVDYKSMERVVSKLLEKKFKIKKSYFVESHLPVVRNIEKLFLPSISFFRRRIAVLAEK